MNLYRKYLSGTGLIVVLFIFILAVNVSAAPEGGEVTAGQAEISQQGDVTAINQSTGKAAI